MKFAIIIPDHGARPQFAEFCLNQLSRMTVKPDATYLVNYKQEVFPDLTQRIKSGVQQAKNDGYENVFIIETDDYYPHDYFEKMTLDNSDFVGQYHTVSYHVINKTWANHEHKYRSSLFTTGFKISCLDRFQWPADKDIHLDIRLWEHAKKFKRKFVESGAIGIKHNIGTVAGTYHKREFKNRDSELRHLKNIVDKEAYIFYKSL